LGRRDLQVMESTRLHVYGKSNMDGFEHGPSRYSGTTESKKKRLLNGVWLRITQGLSNMYHVE